jgi:hypothetical protein
VEKGFFMTTICKHTGQTIHAVSSLHDKAKTFSKQDVKALAAEIINSPEKAIKAHLPSNVDLIEFSAEPPAPPAYSLTSELTRYFVEEMVG